MSQNEEELIDRRSTYEVEQDALKLRRSFEIKHSRLNLKLEKERERRGECSLRNCGYMWCGEDECEDVEEGIYEEEESTEIFKGKRYKQYEEM